MSAERYQCKNLRSSNKLKKAILTHVNQHGHAHMVDVGEKPETKRLAKAQGLIRMKPATLSLILAGNAKKGDVLGAARIAGIQATKKTSELIPLCHPLSLTSVTVDFQAVRKPSGVLVTCHTKTFSRTGVEMEALTGVAVALLTIYDMCKSVDRKMQIESISLTEKLEGKSGHFLGSMSPIVK